MPFLKCIEAGCRAEVPATLPVYTCPKCGGLLDLIHELNRLEPEALKKTWDARLASKLPVDRSGVWRFRELMPEADDVVTMLEGNTQIFDAPRSALFGGLKSLAFKHLGMNPTGSFKDLGMTTGVTQAAKLKAATVACASTGNTSASMAAYAARAGMRAVIFIPSGQISLGKLSQALDYGAIVLQIDGDFDEAMSLVREITADAPMYLLNSVNPFRLEGQKAIAFELLQQRDWRVPDRLVIPGGNLGNSSAIAKGFRELVDVGLIDHVPKMTIVQASGADPLYRLWSKRNSGEPVKELQPIKGAATLATAIKIGNPVSWQKALRGLEWSNGGVEEVSEQEIADAKAMIGRDGIGCEPASAVTLAGIRKMIAGQRMDPGEDVVAILTGHVLKDPDYVVSYHRGELKFTDREGVTHILAAPFANRIIQLGADRSEIRKVLDV